MRRSSRSLTLTDIKAWTWDILAILSEEDDDEP
jgi:hypothetical protein